MFNNPIGFSTLLRREVSRFMKVYIQTIVAPLFSNMLFLGIFGGMLKTRSTGLEGVDYLPFLVPGLCAMGAIMAAAQNPSSSIIIQKYQNIIDDLNSYPLSNFEKVSAFTLGGTLRGLLVGTLTYIATIYFVGYHLAHPVLFFAMLTALSFVFSSLGVVVGLVFTGFEKITFLLTIVITPLVYFGGVFFEATKLPGIFGALARFNPMFPFINLTRFGYLGVQEGGLMAHYIFLAAMMIGSFWVAYRLMAKGVGLRS